MNRRPATVDAYLATVAGPRRAHLEALRKAIRSIVPEAEECISYGMPAFRVDGAVVGGFAATARGCSYYPFSGTTLATLASEVSGYARTKSALHFGPDRPLPTSLVRKLLHERIAEIRRARPTRTAPRARRGVEWPSPSRRAPTSASRLTAGAPGAAARGPRPAPRAGSRS